MSEGDGHEEASVAADAATDNAPATAPGTPPLPPPGVICQPCGSTEMDIEWLKCLYDCGPPVPRFNDKGIENFVHKGRQGCKVPVCKPCYNALRSIERSYWATPETKKQLAEFRKDFNTFAALIRRCRIRRNATEIGCDTEVDRARLRVDITKSWESHYGIEDKSKVKWLHERRFIAHQVFKEGIEGDTLKEKEKNAKAMWDKEVEEARDT